MYCVVFCAVRFSCSFKLNNIKTFQFSFFSRAELYLTMSKIYKDMNLGSLSKILTENSTTDRGLLDAIMQVSAPNIHVQKDMIQ